MPISELKLIKRCAEWLPKEQWKFMPRGTRGIYTLLNKKESDKYDVVYIGLSAGLRQGMRRRLRSHASSKRRGRLWTHFSAFEVWDNITEAEVAELEGLFRHIYRKDIRANRINKHRAYNKLYRVRVNDLRKWRVRKTTL